jgi:hypothetical protein
VRTEQATEDNGECQVPRITRDHDADHDEGREPVRLVYHYRDGHDFRTETMLRAEAIAYMPLLRATCMDADHYESSFATIELQVA